MTIIKLKGGVFMINNHSINLYNEVYKNTEMGISTIKDIIPVVENENLKTHLRSANDEYLKFNEKVCEILNQEDIIPRGINPISKTFSQTSIKLNTMLDKSNSTISEMIISGTTMGIIDLQRALNENVGADNLAIDLTQSLIQTEQKNIDQIKKYL
jgi:hypothetical protein